MGFQRPHAYQELIMLTFKDGKVLDAEDLSERGANIRKDIDKNPKSF